MNGPTDMECTKHCISTYKKGAELMTNLLVSLQQEQENNDDNDNRNRELQEQAHSILLDCLNNTAAVYLKAKQYGKAKVAATDVLARDPNNFKALLRAARAALFDPAGTFEESDAALLAAEEVKPDSKELKQLRVEYTRRKRDYDRKSKAMFTKMMKSNTTTKDVDSKVGDAPEAGSKEETESDLSKDEIIEEVYTEGAKLEAAKAVHTEGDQDVAAQTIEKSREAPEDIMTFKGYLWKYRFYIIQLIMPFITYFIFTLVKDDMPVATQEEAVPVMGVSNDGEF
eukprot:CAMPEP_0116573432 /NCGR_PEP_ID=MMETSP0397-20121206/18790_1 /TAXON_ID=216820 /ORGANISM="Cyclophora tenuis, Strain ECT3854" /LENGTH=283 /DNA_ID=CAMNT_0004101995 /DNA_START=76 /DNA_END=927 /DNA_ORIENTATION=+